MRIFRRRPFPRRWRAVRRMGPAAQVALARLQQAHAWLAQGAYPQAAALFTELAEEASARGLPRAPQLFLQAGRAHILAGETASGIACLRQGLTRMAKLGQVGRLPRVAHRVLDELRARGLSTEADSLQAELPALVPGLRVEAPLAASGSARRLPAKCPYCGGTVHPESVEWLDEMSATCDYCGSVVQAET
ncbi:MAG: hypothetical protein AB1449_14230 [Chloroflexota bacterium]